MVKIFFISIICCVLACCKVYENAVLVQNNDFLHYLNYSKPVEFYFSFSNSPVTSVSAFKTEKHNNKIPLTGNDSIKIVKIINDFTYKFYEYEKDGDTVDSISRTDVFFCGKILVVDGIDSYLFLIKKPDMYYDDIGTFSQELYLINSKNEQITSLVIMSSHIAGIDTAINISTYFMYKQYFSQIDYSFPETDLVLFAPPEVINKYFYGSKQRETLYVSSFIIDEDGFIKIITVG